MRPRSATPKKSGYLARRRSGRSQTHERDQDGHPAVGGYRHRGQGRDGRRLADSARVGRLPGDEAPGALPFHRQRRTKRARSKIWRCTFRIGGSGRPITSSIRRLTMDGSKRGRSGPPRNSTTTSVFPTLGQAFVVERQSDREKDRRGLLGDRLRHHQPPAGTSQARNGFSRSTAATG